MTTKDDIGLVRRALARTGNDASELMRRIRPAMHTEISHLLMRMAPSQGRSAKQELDDLMQEAFVALLDNQWKRLAAWDPARGCTLDSYVRMVARTRALDVLRSRRRTPWQADGLSSDEIDGPSPADPRDNENVVLAREILEEVERRLHELLPPRDYTMFVSLFVEELHTADVAAALGMTSAAVYQWSSRFRRNVLPRLIDAIGGPPTPPPQLRLTHEPVKAGPRNP